MWLCGSLLCHKTSQSYSADKVSGGEKAPFLALALETTRFSPYHTVVVSAPVDVISWVSIQMYHKIFTEFLEIR